MKKILTGLFALLSVTAMAVELPKELQQYKLENGLTVMLWEDHDQPDVSGYVVVRAGSIDEPAEYTGLAHYLEHMLFKGTERIGAVDWEAEKPIYDSIIALYDEYALATDPKVREQLATQINQCSMRAAKVSSTEDFFNLLDAIGTEGVNAFTSYDLTAYVGSFPPAEMYRWLTIYSDRLINPVFRTFQAELENVFEEYNMYANEPSSQVQKKFLEKIYEGHPYERDVIGKPEHLKNPRLSKLIEFFNTWYVPNNMALLLVGDFDAEAAKPMIQETFSRLQPKELPERPTYNVVNFKGNPKFSYKLGYNPMLIWAYDGVPVKHEDQAVLSFVCELLSNSIGTGLLDKLTIDGDVQMAGCGLDSRRDMGRIIIEAVPYYDVNQRMFEDNKTTEKIIMKEVDKLKTGQIEDWRIASVKTMYDEMFKMQMEGSSAKMNIMMQSFTYDLPMEVILGENELVQSLSKEQIMAAAKKYFDADHMTLSFDEGTMKTAPLPKPKIEPLDPIKGAETDYAKAFKQLPKGEVKLTYNNFADVQVRDLGDNVTLRYTPNTKNDIFTLTLRYGVGEDKLPMLPYAVALMNTAGVMPSIEAQEFNRQMAEFGATVSYDCDDSYFYISIMGKDANLEKINALVTRQLLMPKLEQKQLDNIKGSVFFSRLARTKRTSAQKSALIQYALYGDKSEYIDEVKFEDVYALSLPTVQSLIAQARGYALDVRYCGTRAIEDVAAALPLTEGMMPSNSPIVKDMKQYTKNTILFLPNANAQQADLYFFINGRPYKIESDVVSDAFNQYLSGGFSSVVLNEIRVKRSMAYTAYGYDATPILQDKDCYFIGYVGTQSDKVVDAVKVYMDILQNMPVDTAAIDNIKIALRQSAQTAKPSMRGKASTFAYWQQLGYQDDPARVNAEAINNLTFDQIEEFYKANVQGKPVTLIIMGDQKKINLKEIEATLGCKTTKLSATKLFAPLDLDF